MSLRATWQPNDEQQWWTDNVATWTMTRAHLPTARSTPNAGTWMVMRAHHHHQQTAMRTHHHHAPMVMSTQHQHIPIVMSTQHHHTPTATNTQHHHKPMATGPPPTNSDSPSPLPVPLPSLFLSPPSLSLFLPTPLMYIRVPHHWQWCSNQMMNNYICSHLSSFFNFVSITNYVHTVVLFVFSNEQWCLSLFVVVYFM